MGELEQIFGMSLTEAEKNISAPANPRALQTSLTDLETQKAETTEVVSTPMTALACKVMAIAQANINARNRSGVTEKLRSCLRAQVCEYDDAAKDKFIRAGLSPKLFAPITSMKTRAAKSLLVDLIHQGGDPLFHITPSPSPTVSKDITVEAIQRVEGRLREYVEQLQASGVTEVSEDILATLHEMIQKITETHYDDVANEIEEEARVRAKRMEKKVWDILVEGGFDQAFMNYIDNICTYGTGFILGPVVRNVAKNKCMNVKGKRGVKHYQRVTQRIPIFESINPMDCYPAPDAIKPEDGPFIIRVKFSADALWRYAQKTDDAMYAETADGWLDRPIADLVRRHPEHGVKLFIEQYDPVRRECEKNGVDDSNDALFEGVRCFMTVRGSELASIGVTRYGNNNTINLTTFYKTETIVIDNRVVYCRIFDDAMEFPISKGVFYSVSGSFWGEAIADKVAACQIVLNNCLKSLMQNMSSSSGAIYWINDVQRLANKSPDALKMRAGVTIPFLQSLSGNQGAPMGSLIVPSVANELLAIWKHMQTQADLDSGIPAFTEGQTGGQGGALRTASGLAMFTENSTRGMKMVMTTTDNDVITKVARMTADFVLLYDDDQSLKGDVYIRSVGLLGKILKAQRDNARMQVLQLALNSQFLQHLLKPSGMLTLFRPVLNDLDMNPDEVIPSKSEVNEMNLLAKIKALNDAMMAQNASIMSQEASDDSGQENMPPMNGAPVEGIEPPPRIQGGVAERRGVA